MKAHLHLVRPEETVIRESAGPAERPWWEAPEFLALAEVRRAMVGGAAPASPARTAEESARQAVFWVLFEVEHLIRHFAGRVEAGESLRIRSSVYKHHDERVDFNLRIVKHVEVEVMPPGRGGAS